MSQNIEAVSYGVGMNIAGSLLQQNLHQVSPEIMAQAIKDVFEGKPTQLSEEEANKVIQAFLNEKREEQFASNKTAGEQFLSQNFKREGVQTTLSGLQYEVLKSGDGVSPGPQDQVTVHYHGTLTDGRVFDSSVERNQPATFGVNQVISGWTEALQLMKVGDKFRLYVPQNLAYGANPHPGGIIEPYMTLIFDVELLDVKK